MSTEQAIDTIRTRMNLDILTRGRVVIIGLGGIGLPMARELITVFGGLAQTFSPDEQITVLLVDGDSFEPANAYRMDIPDFGNKAAVVAQDALSRIDVPGLHLRWLTDYVTPHNIEEVVQEGDCVMLACDNHATRHLVGRRCASGELGSVVLISGANDGIDGGLRGTYGNVLVYARQNDVDLTSPLERFHPEIADPQDRNPEELSCIELAEQGVAQLPFVNYTVASAMCNALLRLLMPPTNERMYDEVALDVLDAVCLPHWISGPQRLGS